MVQTRDGYLWFGTFNGLVRFDGVAFTVFDLANTPQLPSQAIVNLHADRRDQLWISTLKGLVMREGSTRRVFGTNEGWGLEHIWTLAERSNEDLLLTSATGQTLEFARDRLALFLSLKTARATSGPGPRLAVYSASSRAAFGASA